ncbi:MAG: Holliday junction branch migration protein RuvA [Candidatus Kerfeldbacteria bacterium]|nr:Holliday junction branch migration protein RuvA [Candidatus Kerfeldbacteria bacterium]
MIAFLFGTVANRDEKTLTLDVHGVGFRLFVTPQTFADADPAVPIKVMTYLHVREDALELYGFATTAELRLFEKLLSVSGVGPKMALGILSSANVEDLAQAISRGQVAALTSVSGVGTKTAERIIVDLRGKIDHQSEQEDRSLAAVIDALTQLGYTSKEARQVATKTDHTLKIEERIKAALRRMDT